MRLGIDLVNLKKVFFTHTDDLTALVYNQSVYILLLTIHAEAAERLSKWGGGGGTSEKGPFLENRGTCKGKSQSEIILF